MILGFWRIVGYIIDRDRLVSYHSLQLISWFLLLPW